MSENSKQQDPERTAGQPSQPDTVAHAAPAPAGPVPESAGAADAAATAEHATLGGRPGPRRAAAPLWATPASKVKLDPGFDPERDPMRPAARLPLLPSDEEIAESLSATDGQAADDVHVEPSPTAMISMRPPAEEVARRQAAMEKAANTKPVLTRVFQVLIAVFYPIVILVLAIRLVTSSVFLWVEYHRPGFPADSFGFSTEDRLTYGSYTVDYLLNFAPPRYLGGLVNDIGNPLFLAREVQHMADVKSVIVMAFLAGLVLAVVMVIGMVYLARRSFGGIRRALFAGSIATLAVIIGLGVFAVTGWEAFFTEFHKIFFKDGTWTFYTDDTLIRLFPSQFWIDAGIFIGAFVLVVSSLTLAFTWPTRERRQAVAAAQHPGRRAA
ncbi:TIGR01906 family membrane protein [Arthrobacter sp. HY1533]|uniref:TIGR01906 family membrane protein n=1 Tax=Arthrobacter sp. HY1533 TaxID=2970919 RepID=UPI0022B9D5BD|nr:TIGR01906 family membrane protein [Arthrobacter sp. HY1533]